MTDLSRCPPPDMCVCCQVVWDSVVASPDPLGAMPDHDERFPCINWLTAPDGRDAELFPKP